MTVPKSPVFKENHSVYHTLPTSDKNRESAIISCWSPVVHAKSLCVSRLLDPQMVILHASGLFTVTIYQSLKKMAVWRARAFFRKVSCQRGHVAFRDYVVSLGPFKERLMNTHVYLIVEVKLLMVSAVLCPFYCFYCYLSEHLRPLKYQVTSLFHIFLFSNETFLMAPVELKDISFSRNLLVYSSKLQSLEITLDLTIRFLEQKSR